jgi:WD40 repeat protein
MTRAVQRQVLKSFSREFDREQHSLIATDLGHYPGFVFQQLYNRLQWRVAEGEAAARITKEAVRRCAPGQPAWLHLRNQTKESEALIRTFAGQGSKIWACAFSPDARRVVSGSRDGLLRLWETETGVCLNTLEGHEDPVYACAFSPDGSRIVSASEDKTLKLWDAASGRCLDTLKGHTNGVLSCVFSPDGSRIASGSGDGTIKLWDSDTGECQDTLNGHAAGIGTCAFSPDGCLIVSGPTVAPSSCGTWIRECARAPWRGMAPASRPAPSPPTGAL